MTELSKPSKNTAVTILIVLAVLSPLIAVVEARNQLWPTDDQDMFAYYGWCIANGSSEYVDVWDNKPPAIYWVNAIAFKLFDNYHIAIITICTAAIVTAISSFFVAASAFYSRSTAIVLTLIAGVFMLDPYYSCGTNRTETFLIAFELLGIAFYAVGTKRHQWYWWPLAGIACGCAFLFKQVGLAAWGAMLLHTFLLAVFRKLDWKAAIGRSIGLIVGVVAVAGVAYWVLVSRGVFDETWFAVFTFNRYYFDVGASKLMPRYENLINIYDEMKFHLTMPAVLAVMTLLVKPTQCVLFPQKESPPKFAPGPLISVMFLSWFGAAWWGASISPHHFRHYVMPSIPPLLLLAGGIIYTVERNHTWRKLSRKSAGVAGILVALAALTLPRVHSTLVEFGKIMSLREAQWETGNLLPTFEPLPAHDIGRVIASITTPDDVIQGWGFLPEVYLFAERKSASRFTTTEKIGQIGEKGSVIYDDIWNSVITKKPKALFFTEKEFGFLDDTPDKKAWIAANYREIHRQANILVLERQ